MCSYLRRKGKINSKIATIMTDFAPHDQWLVGRDYVDYFFVANDKMKNYLIEKQIPQNNIFVTGIPISERFLENYDRQTLLKKYGLETNRKTILFFGGGEFGLGKTKTLQIFKNFVTANVPIQIIAIAGKNEKMKESFEEIVQEYKSYNTETKNLVKILGFTKNVPELMSISDLVVTKPGGLTTSESLASHLPMVVINPIPGQEEENAEFLESKGIAVWIKKSDDSKKIIENLLLDQISLRQMRENTNLLARPNSTADICRVLLEKSKSENF